MKITRVRNAVKAARYLPPNPYDRGPKDAAEFSEEEVTDSIQIPFDTEIIIDESGSWDFVDDSLKFLESPNSDDGDWYSEEYPAAMIADVDMVADAFEALLNEEPDLEGLDGTYRISGILNLSVESTISYDREAEEDDYGSDWKSTVDVTDVTSEIVERDSSILNFKVVASVESATRIRNRDEYVDYDTIYAADEEGSVDEEYEGAKHAQEFTSKNTAVNSNRGATPALLSKIPLTPNALLLDYGGGQEKAAELARELFERRDPSVDYVWYDKYWQTAAQRKEALDYVRQQGGADIVALANVLNTIKEPEVRLDVLEHIKDLLKPGGTLYIQVHKGTKEDRELGERSTKPDQYQLFRALKDYLDEVQQVFPKARCKGGFIVAPNSGSATL